MMLFKQNPVAPAFLAVIALASWGCCVPPTLAADSSTPEQTQPPSDEAIKKRVESALWSSKDALETHVDVSVNEKWVVLGGFVLSEWDRRHAVEIATKAAGGRRVIDEIHLKEGQAR